MFCSLPVDSLGTSMMAIQHGLWGRCMVIMSLRALGLRPLQVPLAFGTASPTKLKTCDLGGASPEVVSAAESFRSAVTARMRKQNTRRSEQLLNSCTCIEIHFFVLFTLKQILTIETYHGSQEHLAKSYALRCAPKLLKHLQSMF